MKKIRLLLLVLTLIPIAIQIYIFANRVKLQASFTPATEEQLYCTDPILDSFSNLGNGMIEVRLPDRYIIEANNKVMGIESENKVQTSQIKLTPGFNEIKFLDDGAVKLLNIIFTPQGVYAESGNSNRKYSGVLSIYPSSICTTHPLKKINEWTPGNDILSSSNEEFAQAYIEIIKTLEPLRGVPSKIMEDAGLEDISSLVENSTGKVWCQQIALYAVAKLRKHVPVRLVTAGGYVNGDSSVRTGGHDFVEYFDTASRRWVFSDPTLNVLKISSDNGVPLSAADLSRINSTIGMPGIRELNFSVVDQKSGMIKQKKYANMPIEVINELLFHLRDINTFYYYSSESTWYRRNFYDKFLNQFQNNRQFSLSRNGRLMNVAAAKEICQSITVILLLIWLGFEISDVVRRIIKHKFKVYGNA